MAEGEEQAGWDALDPREPELLSRLMLDSVLPAALNDGQAIALGVAYANLAHAEALREHTEALERVAAALENKRRETRIVPETSGPEGDVISGATPEENKET